MGGRRGMSLVLLDIFNMGYLFLIIVFIRRSKAFFDGPFWIIKCYDLLDSGHPLLITTPMSAKCFKEH
jgi:hypothetical protein